MCLGEVTRLYQEQIEAVRSAWMADLPAETVEDAERLADEAYAELRAAWMRHAQRRLG